MLQDLFAEAKSQLPALTQDKATYRKLLVGLILQGAYQLMETKIVLQCRDADKNLILEASAEAKKTFESELKGSYKVDFVIDESAPLPPTSPGGVTMSVMDGRIRAVNTLDERLDLLAEKVCD